MCGEQVHLHFFQFSKGDNNCDALFSPWMTKHISQGSTLEGKNLLIGERILFSQSLFLLKGGGGGRNEMSELLSLEMYLSTVSEKRKPNYLSQEF